MKKAFSGALIASLLAICASTCHAKDNQRTSPQAATRTYAQNFKDMVLATCLANAYKSDKHAATDTGSSVSALRDWSNYDLEKAPDEIKALVNDYLVRDYSNPLVEAEIKDVHFDFLKCLDLYHSKALNAQIKRLVIHPNRTYRQDNPLPGKSK